MGIASSLRLASRATGSTAPPSASPVALAGPPAAAGVVAVAGPVAAAAARAAAGPTPGAAVGAEAAVVVAAMAETAVAPQTSLVSAAGDGAAAAEPGSYSAPMTPLSSDAWGPAPPQRIRHRGGASATYPPLGPCCSESWLPSAPSLCRRVPGLHGWTGWCLDRRAGGCRAKC
jgi:hypothetical protein